MKSYIHSFITLVFLLSSLVFAFDANPQNQSYSFKLYPYDETLAQQLNQDLSESNIRFAEDPPRNEFYLGTLRWDRMERMAFSAPGNEGESHEARDVPYDTKKHRMRQLEKEAQQENGQKEGNFFTRLFGGGSKEKKEKENNGGYQSTASPYDTKKHRMRQFEQETSSSDTENTEQSLVDSEPDEEKQGFFSRLFGGGSEKEDDNKNEGDQSTASPYDTKKHVVRKVNQSGTGESPNDESEAPEAKEAEEAQTQVKKEEKKGFFSRLFGGGNKKSKKDNPSHDGSPVVIAAPPPKMSKPVFEQTNPQEQQVSDNSSEPAGMPPQAKTSSTNQGEPVSVPENEPQGAQMVGLQQSQPREEKGFFAQVFDSIKKPFSGGGGRSYTIESEIELPTGRSLSLPSVKSRDESELKTMFVQLAAQSSKWIQEGKSESVRALNSAASARNPHDLEEKIQRAKENPNWLNSRSSQSIGEFEGSKPGF